MGRDKDCLLGEPVDYDQDSVKCHNWITKESQKDVLM